MIIADIFRYILKKEGAVKIGNDGSVVGIEGVNNINDLRELYDANLDEIKKQKDFENRYLGAKKAIFKNFKEAEVVADYYAVQVIENWAKTQGEIYNVGKFKSKKGYFQKCPDGNGVYLVTGLENTSSIHDVLEKLNSLGDAWSVADNSFVLL